MKETVKVEGYVDIQKCNEFQLPTPCITARALLLDAIYDEVVKNRPKVNTVLWPQNKKWHKDTPREVLL